MAMTMRCVSAFGYSQPVAPYRSANASDPRWRGGKAPSAVSYWRARSACLPMVAYGA
jgi:hypothetical protein